jgi:hypothetical protein
MTGSPEAVSFTAKHSLAWVFFLSLLAIVLIATYAYFLPANGQFGWYRWAGGLSLLLLCLGLARLAWRQPRGRLRFDGIGWWWQPQGDAADQVLTLELALDLQSHILLRCTSTTATYPAKQHVQWMCLSRSSAPQVWLLFRRAVYWRGQLPTTNHAPTPTAAP